MVAGWSHTFSGLQERGLITGFAYITANGVSQPVTGPFVNECASGAASPQLQGIVAAAAAPEAPTSFDLWGTKLITLHHGNSCFMAVPTRSTGGGSNDGIVAVKAPNGVLLASFNKPTLPTIALTAVQEAAAAAFKRKRSPGDEGER
uniref:Profilin n=1 Tax=Tetradesmus obliquus TaxID=3088 RepID=A0A383WNS0_TETOB|eukprot:jgi/Sobl393_1/18800/SZX79108.1